MKIVAVVILALVAVASSVPIDELQRSARQIGQQPQLQQPNLQQQPQQPNLQQQPQPQQPNLQPQNLQQQSRLQPPNQQQQLPASLQPQQQQRSNFGQPSRLQPQQQNRLGAQNLDTQRIRQQQLPAQVRARRDAEKNDVEPSETRFIQLVPAYGIGSGYGWGPRFSSFREYGQDFNGGYHGHRYGGYGHGYDDSDEYEYRRLRY